MKWLYQPVNHFRDKAHRHPWHMNLYMTPQVTVHANRLHVSNDFYHSVYKSQENGHSNVHLNIRCVVHIHMQHMN